MEDARNKSGGKFSSPQVSNLFLVSTNLDIEGRIRNHHSAKYYVNVLKLFYVSEKWILPIIVLFGMAVYASLAIYFYNNHD